MRRARPCRPFTGETVIARAEEDHRGVGATGAQGGGLARAILADKAAGSPSARITPDADSDKAQGAGRGRRRSRRRRLDDQTSLERAFAGAYGAFCVTNFWEHFSPEKEIAAGEHMARAAKAAGLQHVIWSTLEDTRKWVPLTTTACRR